MKVLNRFRLMLRKKAIQQIQMVPEYQRMQRTSPARVNIQIPCSGNEERLHLRSFCSRMKRLKDLTGLNLTIKVIFFSCKFTY